MRKFSLLTTVLIALFINSGYTQNIFNFESLTVPETTGYWNGSDLSEQFGDTETVFYNSYNADWSSWQGFSYAFDTITVDKQFMSTPVTANSGSVFGIGFVASDWMSGTYDNIPIKCSFTSPVLISSVFVSNSQYTSDVIINGIPDWGISGFAEGDWFKIIIEGKNAGESKGFVEYYLADYRDGASFVLDYWNQIDLSSLGAVDTLKFNLQSSDTGEYGMNTPAYFCIDDLTYYQYTGVEDIKTQINIYPNPADNFISIQSEEKTTIVISDMSGKIIFSKKNCSKLELIDISKLSSGIYIVKSIMKDKILSEKFIKN